MDDATVERVARALCSASGENPEIRAYPGAPFQLRGGYGVVGEGCPAWHLRIREARAVIEILFGEEIEAD